jgi:hypothetical protein
VLATPRPLKCSASISWRLFAPRVHASPGLLQRIRSLRAPHPTTPPRRSRTHEVENPNGASILFLVDGVEGEDLAGLPCIDMFDGNDPDAVEAARRRWRAGGTAGHTVTIGSRPRKAGRRRPKAWIPQPVQRPA